MQVIQQYFDRFNSGDVERMLLCLSDDITHHVNEGQVRVGKTLFSEFCTHMNACYRENLTDMVIFTNNDGTRAAAEYVVNGTYLKTDSGLPEARGQKYCLPAGSFFNIRDGKISRVTTYYNLADWVQQVNA